VTWEQEKDPKKIPVGRPREKRKKKTKKPGRKRSLTRPGTDQKRTRNSPERKRPSNTKKKAGHTQCTDTKAKYHGRKQPVLEGTKQEQDREKESPGRKKTIPDHKEKGLTTPANTARRRSQRRKVKGITGPAPSLKWGRAKPDGKQHGHKLPKTENTTKNLKKKEQEKKPGAKP